MKKFVLYPLLSLLSLIILLVTIVGGILFFKPTLIINPKNIDFVLRKTKILKTHSWTDADITHQWIKWNERIIKGYFKNLCFEFDNDTAYLNICLSEISWNFTVTYVKGEGIKSITNSPIFVRDQFSKIVIKESKTPPPENESQPDIWGLWSMFWSPLVPDLDFVFDENELTLGKESYQFDVTVIKSPHKFHAKSLGFSLDANPEGFMLLAPSKFKIPKLKFNPPLHLYDVKLIGAVKKNGIPLDLSGGMEKILFHVTSKIELPLKDSFSSLNFRKKAILATRGDIRVPDVKQAIGRFAPSPFNVLPAPLNSMDGAINIEIVTKESEKNEEAIVTSKARIDLKSKEQVFLMDLGADLFLNLLTMRPVSVLAEIDFKKVNLALPKISKKSLPPQFTPDKRIITQKDKAKVTKKTKSQMEMTFRLEAMDEKSLHLSTNLLDQPLRLNFDLNIEEGDLKNGFVKVLPLKTKVFKRPIQIPSMQINFDAPAEPVLVGQVIFPLPEYKITMDLEGPISQPRYAFSSKPPLSRNDIYSVLLFGRPLEDLNPDDKRSASQTNQILAQGIMSLSVLYFLAGSPVEYIGYDPNSKTATAQFRLGSKSSLRVGGDSEGLNSTGIRQTIGKGWYIDTSATSTQKSSTGTTGNARDYGVMLERIISY
ncbi:translocation/assembly module TamB domain-containing protein [Peredibacter starrii]|uniref:Translocation/assembly module TamB domain-containing protein n=1 Tax=Peredibacter starrii TaxID=28202 RepID=A0AAX4HM96_9BACT|nr:translocation/assembly module TamB domain-containing protein [Peredibacter starrii]WPU64336.1 translocation/assembly module TamB domain-containing protein [Peredibacter starrii]